jgi:hypothetical protein
MGRLVPRLPDDVERKIATMVARSKFASVLQSLEISQRETAYGKERLIGETRGLLFADHAVLPVGETALRPLVERLYNFTLMRRSDGAIGVLESNCGQGYWRQCSTEPFTGILPWGKSATHPVHWAGWSRATRSVTVDVPVWVVPRVWGFDNIKNNFSKVIVHETGVKDTSPDARGILDDEEIEARVERLAVFPEETLSPRTV